MGEKTNYNKCLHERKEIGPEIISYCKFCGVIMTENVSLTLINLKIIGIKPNSYNFSPDLSPFVLYDQMYIDTINFTFHLKHSNYISKRNNIFRSMQQLCTRLNFREQTLYLAIFYLDIIYTNTNNSALNSINTELASVCCVLLAGIFRI